jgi:hypothetical protein
MGAADDEERRAGWQLRLSDFDPPYSWVTPPSVPTQCRVLMTLVPYALNSACVESYAFGGPSIPGAGGSAYAASILDEVGTLSCNHL